MHLSFPECPIDQQLVDGVAQSTEQISLSLKLCLELSEDCFYSLLITQFKSTHLSTNPFSLPRIPSAIYALSRYSVSCCKNWHKQDWTLSSKDPDSREWWGEMMKVYKPNNLLLLGEGLWEFWSLFLIIHSSCNSTTWRCWNSLLFLRCLQDSLHQRDSESMHILETGLSTMVRYRWDFVAVCWQAAYCCLSLSVDNDPGNNHNFLGEGTADAI